MAGGLSTKRTSSASNTDDFNQAVNTQLPASFPKGYKGFYCMKYEISQEQYAEFLKKLSTAQATARYQTGKYGVSRFSISPTFTVDSPDRACGFIHWFDGVAYADWAGLRPMTELEFEKACRGPVYPVAGEFAWGSTVVRQLKTIVNDGTASETDGDLPRSNAHYGQGTDVTNPLFGPMRAGWTVGGSRENAGDTYYGISDMSGNLYEFVVSVGSAEHRAFVGSHGDGNLTASGHADNSDWPGYSATDGKITSTAAIRTRGGGILGSGSDNMRVSRRPAFSIQTEVSDRKEVYFGFRGVRTAP